MKYINKKQEPDDFIQWKIKKSYLTDIREQYGQFKKKKSVKESVKKSLLEEQGFICCYCERVIDLDSSHIEHLIPRDHNIDLSLEYSNLLVLVKEQNKQKR